MDTSSYKIEAVVQSKYPDILAKFREGFSATTQGYDILLTELTGDEFGAKPINRLISEAIQRGCEIIGVLNDDLVFSHGWMSDVMQLIRTHDAVSPGYVETRDMQKFRQAVEATKKEEGVAPHFYGPVAFFRTTLFRRIGIFDERFSWSCDDLDLAWRIKLNNLSSVTAKRITVAHLVGASRERGRTAWRHNLDAAKQKFYDKHGYVAYREVRREYKDNHQYFVQFR